MEEKPVITRWTVLPTEPIKFKGRPPLFKDEEAEEDAVNRNRNHSSLADQFNGVKDE